MLYMFVITQGSYTPCLTWIIASVSVLAEDAIKAALNDWKVKQKKSEG